jgi:nucleoporin NDC1
MAAVTVRKAPYKDFLQPALQRRFSLTAAVLLVVSYLEAVLVADWNSCELRNSTENPLEVLL